MKALLLLAAPLCASLSAQTVSASAVFQQPLVMTIVDANGTPHTQTIAAGTPVNQSPNVLFSGSTLAVATGVVTTLPTAATISLYQFASVGTGRSASLGPADILCTLTATAPTPVVMQVQWIASVPATAQAQLQLDIHNDGSVDYRVTNPSAAGSTTGLGRFTLGPTPLAVRITMQTSNTANIASQRAILSILPDTGATIQSTTLPCDSRQLDVLPAFDGTLRVSCPTVAFQILVLGLTAQPTQLPLTFSSPCLLIPAPDAVMAMPGNETLVLSTQSLHGMPLWMQAVVLTTVVSPSSSVFYFLP